MKCTKNGRRAILSVVWLLLGIALLGCGAAGVVDEFWSGMGGGFTAVGILQLVRHIRYRTNEKYREKVDVESKDERNRFIANKAWAWAGYLFVMAAAVAVIIFALTDQHELMMLVAGSISLIVLLYWGSYMILRKKY